MLRLCDEKKVTAEQKNKKDFLKNKRRKLKPFFSVSLCILRMMMKLLSYCLSNSQIEETVVPKKQTIMLYHCKEHYYYSQVC